MVMNILQAAIDSLWYWTYGLIVGWGASFTIAVGLIILLFIRYYQLRRRLSMIENRLISHEREYSFHIRDKHDIGYEVTTHEKQAEFDKKRNYTYGK
jgi:hypothetical protein